MRPSQGIRIDGRRRSGAVIDPVMYWTNGAYEIDDEQSRLDMDRVVAWLAESLGTAPSRRRPCAALGRGRRYAGALSRRSNDRLCSRRHRLHRFAYLSTSMLSRNIAGTDSAAGWCRPCSTTRTCAGAGCSTPLTPPRSLRSVRSSSRRRDGDAAAAAAAS